MALLNIPRAFPVLEEGDYIFKINEVEYKADIGIIKLHCETTTGSKHIERFDLSNEKALNRFGFIARIILQSNDDNIETDDLIGKNFKATVTVNESNGKKYANLTNVQAYSIEYKNEEIDLDALLGDD